MTTRTATASLPAILLALALLAALPSRAYPDQPTFDFDFGSLLYGPPTGNDQQTTLAVDSVRGNDTNAGTLLSPRLTLPATLASTDLLGLYRGSFFRASLSLTAATTANGSLSVRGLSLAAGALPMVSALDPVVNAACTSNGDGTYTYAWTPQDAAAFASAQAGSPNYGQVYVVEINTATEAATPVAARRRMSNAQDRNGAAATVGSAAISGPNNGQWTALFHPSDGLAPGSGSYRYEVVSRVAPANWSAVGTGNASLSGLELVGSYSGYGSLAGAPTGFVGDRLVLLHGTTHTAVIGGGSLSRSLLYEMGVHGAADSASGDGIPLAIYSSGVAGLDWSLDRVYFYTNVGKNVNDGPPYALITHSGNYLQGTISQCVFLGARLLDGSLQGTAIDCQAEQTLTISGTYVQGFAASFGNSMAAGTETKNSVFRQVNSTLVAGSFHDNLVAAESGSNAVDLNHRAPVGFVFQAGTPQVSHNLFWAHGLPTTLPNDNQAVGFAWQAGAAGTATHNIIVLDPATPATQASYFQNAVPAGTVLDDNLVICTGAFYAGGTQNNFSWAAYQANNPALDAHSLYVDLSNDPRGLQAVFADPANGDFRWAQTAVASQCAAYCQANGVGPATVTTHWPLVPTVDQAVAAISLLPPKITSPGTVTFTEGASGQYQITTDLDGTPGAPNSYSAAGQPAWLSVVASRGLLFGTPPQAGNTSLSVGATNLAGTGGATLGITVQTAFTAWQNTYFTTAELNNPAISGPNATPAGDAIPNLMKYALGLAPKSNDTGGLPTGSLTTAGNSRFLTLTYNRSLAAGDITYTVEVSGDLQTWSSGGNATATVSTTTNAAGTMQTVVQRDLTPTSSAKQRFIRLKINQL